MSLTSENVGIAFGLVIFAGAATSLGAAVVFFPKCVKFANLEEVRYVLACGNIVDPNIARAHVA